MSVLAHSARVPGLRFPSWSLVHKRSCLVRCSSGALADSKPEREAWLGAASGTSQAAVRLPPPALVQTVPNTPFLTFPSIKLCSR